MWAIAHFRSRLRDSSLPHEQRSQALKFLVHFVVDLHQPLHVGRATDRGGTAIDVFHGGKRVSLHRFWDTDAIRDEDQPAAHYAAIAESLALSVAAEDPRGSVRRWAAESLSYRAAVYAFDSRTGRLDEKYVMLAGDIVERRLVQAGLRLADLLNGLYCPSSFSLSP